MLAQPCPHSARARRALIACRQGMHAAANDAEAQGAKVEAALIRGWCSALPVAANKALAAQAAAREFAITGASNR